MNAIEDSKLHYIFEAKYKELLFSEDKSFETWSSYLRHINCIPCEWAYQARDIMSVSEREKYEIIHNPSPFGGFILVSKELTLIILSIGLP